MLNRVFSDMVWIVLLLPASVFGQQPENASTGAAGEMAVRIDALLSERLEEEGVDAAPPADDAEFVRRAYLDLVGVIPAVSEVRVFLDDSRDDKQSRLIDRLLVSPAHATHLARTWQHLMLPAGETPEQAARAATLQRWLRQQFAQNTRYDRIVADFLVSVGDERGPAVFYVSQELKPEKLAASTAKIFLGLQIECAQCHDHPYDHWKQSDFWGYAAFFARVGQVENRRPGEPIQLVDLDQGEVRLPDSDETVPPKYPGGDDAGDDRGGTRRTRLAVWMASRHNPYLARAAVNRAWAHLFGHGLVEPVDDLGPHNPASHPELLDELSTYFARTGFDLRELYRALAQTRAYQRTSLVEGDQPPRARLFSTMALKPLTPNQFYDSLNRSLTRTAGRNSDDSPASPPGVDPFRQAFLAKVQSPSATRADYTTGVVQALALINGSETEAASDPARGSLLAALEAPIFTNAAQVDTLFLATLSRFPSSAERAATLEYLDAAETDEMRRQALGDVLWALLNSAEFAMNH